MTIYRLHNPNHIIVGREIIGTAAREIRKAGGRRVLMVTESVLASGPAAKIRDEFESSGLNVAYFAGAESDSLSTTAEAALKLGRNGFVDTVLGFGSPTTLNLARLIAVMLPGESGVDHILDAGTITAQRRGAEQEDQPGAHSGAPRSTARGATRGAARGATRGAAMISVPSEPFDPLLFSMKSLVIDARNRVATLVELESVPDYVLVDFGYFDTVTPRQAYLSVAAAMLQSAEAIFSTRECALTQALHEDVVRRAVALFDHVGSDPAEVPDDFGERVVELCVGSAYASSRTALGPGLGLCAAIHSRTDLGVVTGASTIVGPTLAALARTIPESVAKLAELTGADESVPERIEARVRELIGSAGLPLRLRDLEIKQADVPKLVSSVDGLGVLGPYGGALTDSIIEEIADAAQ